MPKSQYKPLKKSNSMALDQMEGMQKPLIEKSVSTNEGLGYITPEIQVY
jgi:hypothetical protein